MFRYLFALLLLVPFAAHAQTWGGVNGQGQPFTACGNPWGGVSGQGANGNVVNCDLNLGTGALTANGGINTTGTMNVGTVSGTNMTLTGALTGASATLTGPVSFRGRIDVTSPAYGAKGDGVTNDTAAIQAAINAGAGSAVVVVPNTGHDYIVGALTVPSNTQLEIDGTLFLVAGANASLLTIAANANNVVIGGTGTLNGNKANQTGVSAGIETATASGTNIWIRGITITEFLNWPVNLTGVNGAWMVGITATNSGNSVEFAVGTHNCWADRISVSGISDMDFAFYGGVYACGISNSFLFNSLTNQGIGAINDSGQTAPVHDITIANNVVYGNYSNGIQVNEGTGAGGNNYNITITGNRVYGNNTGNGNSAADIEVGTITNSSIIGNTLGPSGNGSIGMSGILLNSNTNTVTISGNTIFNEGTGSTNGVGIQFAGTPVQILVEGNYIFDNQATKTMAYALNGAIGGNSALIGNLLGPTISGNPDNSTKVSGVIVAEAQSIGQPYQLSQATGLSSFTAAGQIVGALPVAAAVTATAGTTLTAAQIAGGLIARSGPTAAFTDTTDTAANIIAAINSMGAGEGFDLSIQNTTADALTLAAGTGVTLAGTTTVSATSTRRYRVTMTGAGAVTITGVMQGAN